MAQGRPKKWSDELVAEIRYQRNVEKRKVKWLSERYEIPVDTVRDWLFRGRRSDVAQTAPLHKVRTPVLHGRDTG